MKLRNIDLCVALAASFSPGGTSAFIATNCPRVLEVSTIRRQLATQSSTGADLGLLAGGVSVSRSHVILLTNGGGATHVSFYLHKG